MSGNGTRDNDSAGVENASGRTDGAPMFDGLSGADEKHGDWIRKPDYWPVFMAFPTRWDVKEIRRADEEGGLDAERKKKFNKNFRDLSDLMRDRAKQMNDWIISVNEKIMPGERNWVGVAESHIKKDIHTLHRYRARLELERDRAARRGRIITPDIVADPFMDIKWAILLDPHAPEDDPRFTDVHRWGHGLAILRDGGVLRVDENGVRRPSGTDGTFMAGKMAVREAFERGWSSINVSGEKEFIEGARREATRVGIGASVTTRYGLMGKSRTEYILPKPPKMTEADISRKGPGRRPSFS